MRSLPTPSLDRAFLPFLRRLDSDVRRDLEDHADLGHVHDLLGPQPVHDVPHADSLLLHQCRDRLANDEDLDGRHSGSGEKLAPNCLRLRAGRGEARCGGEPNALLARNLVADWAGLGDLSIISSLSMAPYRGICLLRTMG